MKKVFEFEIECENAAFGTQFDFDNPYYEIARILRDLADSLERGCYVKRKKIYDTNGNAVGYCKLSNRPNGIEKTLEVIE